MTAADPTIATAVEAAVEGIATVVDGAVVDAIALNARMVSPIRARRQKHLPQGVR